MSGSKRTHQDSCMSESNKATPYTSQDIDELARITQAKLNGPQKMKRGRKTSAYAAYSQKVEAQIAALREVLADPSSTEDRKNQVRNQISAYQARLAQRTTAMEQELKLAQKEHQLELAMSAFKGHVNPVIFEQISTLIGQIKPDINTISKTQSFDNRPSEDQQ